MSEISTEINIELSELNTKDGYDSLIGELIRHHIITSEEGLGFISEDSDEEIELEAIFEGSIVPYSPATGPTYSCGGQPAEGGYCEDEYVFIPTQNSDNLKKGHRLQKIINSLRTKKYEDEAMSRKALDLRMKLRAKRFNLIEIDITEYLTDNQLEEYSREAYEANQE